MEPFTILDSVAAPMWRANIDTDTIWPALGGGSTLKGQQAQKAFATLRFDAQGQERADFVLNRHPYRHAKILIAGSNFGCGSSREMAVWALVDWGLRCVIAPGFGDIFYGNACVNGLLPVTLPFDVVENLAALADRAPDDRIVVDLVQQEVRAPDGQSHHFQIGAHHRHMLLHGLDDIAFTLGRLDRIEAFEKRYHQLAPWTRIDRR
ncbi:3-isopropylmalate dehydratase small subunit [Paraburkholderia phytofirmans]|uniref:3-isopropylmalate dehydratase small subunit n=1 Tax=Paraburkholderia phytofirmans TaxID=261302 RepID=UPI0038B896D3